MNNSVRTITLSQVLCQKNYTSNKTISFELNIFLRTLYPTIKLHTFFIQRLN